MKLSILVLFTEYLKDSKLGSFHLFLHLLNANELFQETWELFKELPHQHFQVGTKDGNILKNGNMLKVKGMMYEILTQLFAEILFIQSRMSFSE